MLTAYGLEPVAPVWGRSEEETACQENNFLMRWSNPCSLSLVPAETFGVIQSSWSGLPGWGFGSGF
jgi:hypothetical protein